MGNLACQTYTIDKMKPSVVNATTTGIQSFESNGTTAGDGIFEANDYLKITFERGHDRRRGDRSADHPQSPERADRQAIYRGHNHF